MDKHTKKMIAPVVITLLFVLYTCGCGIILMAVDGFNPALLLLAIPFVILGAGMVYVLFARILEAPEQEGIYLAEIDMDMLREYRAHEVMGDKYRNPNVYGLLATEGKRYEA